MNERTRVLQACDISIPAQQTNAVYMAITMRMFSTRPNTNGDGVTERFIDAIIERQPEHVGLPLYADTTRLRSRDYANLGHRYDPMSGEFLTEEIGSFCHFEKTADEYGISLFGEARVYKRSQKICAALLELYNLGTLNVSFEIAYDTLLVIDGVEYIDASPNNVITGMAIVSNPAYPEAVATRQIAEETPEEAPLEHEPIDVPIEPEATNTERVNEMTLEKAMARIAEQETEVNDLTTRLNQPPTPDAPADTDDAASIPLADHEAALEKKDTEIAALQAQVETLSGAEKELDALKQAQAAAEDALRKETLTSFAQTYGLDVASDPVAQAIEALDYEAIVAAAAEKQEQPPKTATTRPMSDIGATSPYGGILDKANQ